MLMEEEEEEEADVLRQAFCSVLEMADMVML